MPLIDPWTENRSVDQLDAFSERFYARLRTKLDDYGRFHADAQILKSMLFPLRRDIRDADISRWLASCQKAGLLRCYVDALGRAILEMKDAVQKHKKFALKADFPPPEDQGQLPLNNPLEEKGREGKRMTKTTKSIEALSKGGTGGKQNGHLPLSSALSALALRFEHALDGEWLNDAGKWVSRVKSDAAKCERIIAEIESAITESRIKTTPARYAEHIWKEFT